MAYDDFYPGDPMEDPVRRRRLSQMFEPPQEVQSGTAPWEQQNVSASAPQAMREAIGGIPRLEAPSLHPMLSHIEPPVLPPTDLEKYKEQLGKYPQYEKPGRWQRIRAGIAGVAGGLHGGVPEAQYNKDQVLYGPYRQKVRQYLQETEPYRAKAELEMTEGEMRQAQALNEERIRAQHAYEQSAATHQRMEEWQMSRPQPWYPTTEEEAKREASWKQTPPRGYPPRPSFHSTTGMEDYYDQSTGQWSSRQVAAPLKTMSDVEMATMMHNFKMLEYPAQAAARGAEARATKETPPGRSPEQTTGTQLDNLKKARRAAGMTIKTKNPDYAKYFDKNGDLVTDSVSHGFLGMGGNEREFIQVQQEVERVAASMMTGQIIQPKQEPQNVGQYQIEEVP